VELSSDDVQDILKLLDVLPFAEMRLQTSRFTLVLRRAPDGGWTQETQVLSEPTVLPAAPAPGRDGGAEGAEEGGQAAAGTGAAAGASGGQPAAGAPGGLAAGSGTEPGEADGLAAVRAPLPGTFYRAPRPGAPPFVEEGSRVEPDTVVGIVETMKLMNSVSAGVSGTVEQIVLANAQSAEKDAVLMTIREQR
jgi:acetyl-CoA carboxylase biotin carboxyl carrier protein